MPDLVVDGLSVAFPTSAGPVQALQQVGLAIPQGGALGLVGESGSGKSTVILALLGLLGRATVTAGRLAFGDADLLTQAPLLRGRRIAVVFQDPASSLNPALTIGAQVAEPLRLHARLSAAAALTESVALLAEVGLPRPAALHDAYPHQLSGGMKQRVAIAMALAARPDLLLLDEPTTALDVTVEANILDLLGSLRARLGLSLLLVSHNLGLVDRLCDRATVLYAGRVVETGPSPAVLQGARHPYTRGLLACLPRGGRATLAPIPGTLPDLKQPHPGCNFRPRCPFAVPGCEAPQALPTEDHAARCWRAASVQDSPWPASPALPRAETGPGVLLEADNLTRRFGLLTAVDAVSLAIAPSEVLGLVGESGCGKSTLGRLLLRLLPADAGTLRFAGADVAPVPPLAFRQRAQIVLQNPDTALNPRQRVRELIGRPLRHFGLARGREAEEVDRLLALVRLPPAYAGRFPHQLSGGEKQRVGIARALASRPAFIVCDEAVSALDVSVQAAILNLLAELRATLGLALLFVSHDLGVIAHASDRVAVMYGGALVEVGPTAAVLRAPHHPYTEALLSAVPTLGLASARVSLPGEPGEVHRGAGCRFALRCHRRVGPACLAAAPPWRQAGPSHGIRCHIPVEQLA